MSENKITLDRMDQIVRAAFEELKSRGGRAKVTDLVTAIEPKLTLTSYERERTPHGTIRWEEKLRWYTVGSVRAGFLIKTGGEWILTEEGKKALSLPPGQLLRTAEEKYRRWRKEVKSKEPVIDVDVPEIESDEAEHQAIYEQAVEKAREGIEKHIGELGPYDFQKLVAELLKAMGYYVPFIAEPGPDGGVDLEAYKDPLGTTAPRIKVQVKHREQKASVKEIRELEGLLRKDGDIGLFVSSGGFSTDAKREIRSSNKHIETMDLDRLVDLWQGHYDKISERGKALLPLVKVFFIAPTED